MDYLPNEILSYIFSLIILDPDENPAFLLSLSQVCSRWRDLAISTNSLWSRLAFTFPVNNFQYASASVSLQRSGTYPLTILLECRDPDWEWDEDGHKFEWTLMQSIIQLLRPHAARWRSITILTDTWSPIYTFLSLMLETHCLPLLETLSLSRCNAYFAARGQTFQPLALRHPVALFGGATLGRLRNVSLVGVHVDWTTSALKNLHTLEFKYQSSDVMPTLPQFAAILNRCPGLLHLSVIGWGPTFSPEESKMAPSLFLPSLTKLSFGFIDIPYATQFLSLFHLPSLQELDLEDVSKTVSPLDIQDSVQILRWLYESQPAPRGSFSSVALPSASPMPLRSVKRLQLQSIQADEATFFRFLQCFPRLESVSYYDLPDESIMALAPQNPTSQHAPKVDCVCPLLSELYCQDASPDVLVDTVVARSLIGCVTPLQNITLEYLRNSRPASHSAEQFRLENSGITVLGASSSTQASDSE